MTNQRKYLDYYKYKLNKAFSLVIHNQLILILLYYIKKAKTIL